MINKYKKILILFSNFILFSGIIYSLIILIISVKKIYSLYDQEIYTIQYIFLFFSLAFLFFFVFAFKFQTEHKINISILLFSIGLTFFSVEIFLNFNWFPPKERYQVAEEMGIPYDRRTVSEVIDDFKNQNIESYPNIIPAEFLNNNLMKNDNEIIFPVNGISNVLTIVGNETGEYSVFNSDEHGFNNPKGLYQKDKIDIVLIGDSFMECCVNENETLGSVLRDLGYIAINVGKRGNDTLIEYASLREFAKPMQPKIVLWFYYEYDIYDLTSELGSDFLNQYLENDNFNQNLILNQSEIDQILIEYANKEINKINISNFISLIIKNFKLTNIRSLFGIAQPTHSEDFIKTQFRTIIKKAQKDVSNWGGQFYFVYLPTFNRYKDIGARYYATSANWQNNDNLNRDFILNTIEDLNIPIIDIHKEVFEQHSDPISLFPLRIHSHYSAEGYNLVANTIKNRLDEDGYIPIISD